MAERAFCQGDQTLIEIGESSFHFARHGRRTQTQ